MRPKKPNERKRPFELLHRITDNTLLALLMSGLFTVLFASIGHVYFKTQNDLSQLSTYVTGIVDVDEDAYIFCKSFVADPKNPSPEEENRILDVHNKIENALITLINQQSIVKKYFSPTTSLAVSELACWNNHLFISGKYLCIKSLKNPDRMDEWRDRILTQIEIDQNRQQNVSQILADFLTFLKEFFVKEKPDVTSFHCDLDKISTY